MLGPGATPMSTPVLGTDAITTALIYKPAEVEPVGAFAVLDSSEDPRLRDEQPARARPDLPDVEVGGEVTVVVNHLKSKGSAATRRRSRHRRRPGQLQPDAHGGRRGAGRLARHGPDRTGHGRPRADHRRPELVRQGGPDRRFRRPATPTCCSPSRASTPTRTSSTASSATSTTRWPAPVSRRRDRSRGVDDQRRRVAAARLQRRVQARRHRTPCAPPTRSARATTTRWSSASTSRRPTRRPPSSRSPRRPTFIFPPNNKVRTVTVDVVADGCRAAR